MIKKPINPLQEKMSKANYDDMRYQSLSSMQAGLRSILIE